MFIPTVQLLFLEHFNHTYTLHMSTLLFSLWLEIWCLCACYWQCDCKSLFVIAMANQVKFVKSETNLSKYPRKYNNEIKVKVVSRIRFIETKFVETTIEEGENSEWQYQRHQSTGAQAVILFNCWRWKCNQRSKKIVEQVERKRILGERFRTTKQLQMVFIHQPDHLRRHVYRKRSGKAEWNLRKDYVQWWHQERGLFRVQQTVRPFFGHFSAKPRPFTS